MAYAGYLRTLWQRVKVGNERARLVGSIKITEELENATTSVAEFSLADKSGVNYKRGVVVEIDEMNSNVNNGENGTRVRKMFTGQVDHVKASSYPNTVTIVATGVLGNLRLTTDKDVDLTGMTDQEAVEKILKTCKIPFRPNDIKGSGTELGQREDVIWESGSTGAAMLEELDRVFGYTTVENGEGRVQRIKYSRVPKDYGNNVPQYREFYRGQEGVTFYENDRERGHIEEVINFWEVNGLEYEIGNTEQDGDGDGIDQEGKEGCSRKIWAECKDENHKLLGNNVYVGGEFTSDLIQSPGLAKAICKRMMEWYNREQDTIRVGTANDPRVNVGDLMLVRDNAFGIDLNDRERYLITSVQRDGDYMTLDGIGGDAGNDGKVTGGIRECCGTWDDEGKCEKNPKPDETDPPPLPDLPDLPDDPGEDFCDPAEDPTCIPNDGGGIGDGSGGNNGGGGGTYEPNPDGSTGGGVDPGGESPGDGTGTGGTPPNTTDEYICNDIGVIGTCGGKTVTPVTTPAVITTSLGAPQGSVPQGTITGGMDWALINQWDSLIVPAASAHGATASRLKAMLIVESGGVSGANGAGGAVGLMQVKPEYWSAEAATLGYDLYTNAGQIGMAAAIIGGDVAATAGMDEETAFLTVYYPVLDENGDLCLSCYGESGHTPQMYLDDLDLFMAAINNAAPGSGGGSTTAPPTTSGETCTPSEADGPDECETNADCGAGKWCVLGVCFCQSSITCDSNADCQGDIEGGSCARTGKCAFPCNSLPGGDEEIETVSCSSHSECGIGDGSDNIFCLDGMCHCPTTKPCTVSTQETACAYDGGYGYCDPVNLVCDMPCDPDHVDPDGPDPGDFGTAAGGMCHKPGWNMVYRHIADEEAGECVINGNFTPMSQKLAVQLDSGGNITRMGIIAKPSAGSPESSYFNGNASTTFLNKPWLDTDYESVNTLAYRTDNYLRLNTDGIICVSGNARFTVPKAELSFTLTGHDFAGNVSEQNTSPDVTFYAAPGLALRGGWCPPEQYATVRMSNHGTGDLNDICRPVGHNVKTDGPNGGWFGNWDGSIVKANDTFAPGGYPLNTDGYFKVCWYVGDGGSRIPIDGVSPFALTTGARDRYIAASPVDPYTYKDITLEGDFGESTATFYPLLAGAGYFPRFKTVQDESNCIAGFHSITMSMRANVPDPGDVATYDGQIMIQVWDVQITGVNDPIIGDGTGGSTGGGTGGGSTGGGTGPDGTGSGTCYPNPDYIPPDAGEGQGGTTIPDVDDYGDCISHTDCGADSWCLNGICYCRSNEDCQYQSECDTEDLGICGAGPVMGDVCLYPC